MALTYKYRVWMHGLFAAVLSSLGNGLAVALVDPNDFNPLAGSGWMKLATVLLVSALVALGGYLKAHPLPDPEKDSDYHSAVDAQIAKLESTGDGTVSKPTLGVMIFLAAALGGSLLFSSGCASLPLRERIVQSTQAASTAAGDFQDREIAVYNAKAFPELTDAKHAAIHVGLVKYFDAEYKLEQAILKWDPTQPVPIDVQTALREAQAALAEVRQYVPDQAKTVIDYLSAALSGIQLAIVLSEEPSQ